MLAALFALGIAHPNTTEAAVDHRGTIRFVDTCPFEHTASAFREFSERTWRPIAWERGEPPKKVIRAQRVRLRCAAGPGHRKAMKKRWREDRRVYLEQRERELAQQAYLDAITPPGPGVLAAIRGCESGGDYGINTGNGFFGAYQFTLSTWQSVGGSGYPHEASPRVQDERAARLYREQGPGPWPNCGV